MSLSPRVAAVVLAAGSSRRMGPVNKMLAEIDGTPMLAHVLAAVRASKVSEIVVVTGYESERVRSLTGGMADRVVTNARHAEGLSTSMIAGLDAVSDDAEAAIICLGDMPRVTARQIDRLITAFDPAAGREICIPVHKGERGNPVLWARRFFGEMRKVEGDRGARALLSDHPAAIAEIEMDDDAVLRDVDAPDALAALQRRDR